MHFSSSTVCLSVSDTCPLTVLCDHVCIVSWLVSYPDAYGEMMDQQNVYDCMYVHVCMQDLSVDLPKYITEPLFLNSPLTFWKACGHINEFGGEETKWGYVQHI